MSDIVLKDRQGTKQTYSGVEVIKIADSEGNYNNYVAEPTGDIKITANGSVDVSKYASATVAVPGGSVAEWDGTGVVIAPIEPEEPEQPMTFTINGISYTMENRMTWYAWTRSEYNTDGFSCASENDYVYEAESTNKVTDADGNDVLGTTYIVEGGAYLIKEATSLITFTLNGTTYACPDGITWGEYANLDTTEYPASSNADVRWLDSASDGTGMQFNDNGTWRFILYNGEYVDNTDTIIGRAVYTLEEPPEDELAGAWKLNSRIENNSIEASFNVSGRFNARKTASMSPMISTSLGFIGLSTENFMLTLGIKDATTAPLNQCNAASYKGLAADGKSYSGTGVARSSVYSTFEIYSTLEEVTNGQILLAWLNANATKLSAASLITFIIAGASYQAEEGMTWGEWVESEYNTYTYTLSGSKVVDGRGYWVQLNGQSCFGTDFIIDGATYVCVAASGSN